MGLPWRDDNTSRCALVGFAAARDKPGTPASGVSVARSDKGELMGFRLFPSFHPRHHRRGGRQLGARCRSLVVEREDPATHGRHSRSRLLAEPGAASAPVAECFTRSSRRLSPLYCRRPRAQDRDAARRMPRPPADHRAPPPRRRAAGIRRTLHRSPAAPVAASPAARSHSSPSGCAFRPLRRDRLGGLSDTSMSRSHEVPRVPDTHMLEVEIIVEVGVHAAH
jgi:hypothetical protein